MARHLPAAAATLLVAVACGDPPQQRSLAPQTGSQYMSFANSEWSEPVHLPAPINSQYRELAAALSPDGLALYFGSDRPGGLGAFDLWVSRRACLECTWGDALNLGPTINSTGGDGQPSFSPDGLLLFFSSSRAGGYGGEDVWVASRTDKHDDFGWGEPVNLGPSVNSGAQETAPLYVPAMAGGGANFYFSSGGTLYQTRVGRDAKVLGPVSPVVGLGSVVSGPTVRVDGREIVFWSTRPGGVGLADLWVATRQSPNDTWSKPTNLAALNTPGPDLTPSLSLDGRTLFFAAGANARESLGFQDIWMSTRTPNPQ